MTEAAPELRPGRGGARPGAGRPRKTEQADSHSAYAEARARREWARAELDVMRLRREALELLPAEDFRRGMAEAFKLLATTLESLPDVLERDCALAGSAVERVQRVVDNLREDLYRRMCDL